MSWSLIVDEHTRKICRMFVQRYSRRPIRPRSSNIFLEQVITPEEERVCKISRILSMKIGYLWQALAGEVPGVMNHGTGHLSGIDLEGADFVMELKNQVCTDNASSRAENQRKLLRYARIREKCPIYGLINDHTPRVEVIRVNDDETIHLYTGRKLREFLFREHVDEVETLVVRAIRFMKQTLEDVLVEPKMKLSTDLHNR